MVTYRSVAKRRSDSEESVMLKASCYGSDMFLETHFKAELLLSWTDLSVGL